MIKDFNIFKTSPKDRYLRNINEEYYYDQDETSWWRRSDSSSINKKEIISKEDTEDDPELYGGLIEEIQGILSDQRQTTQFVAGENGIWNNSTTKGIELFKKKFEYDWESGKFDGTKICKSLYKFMCYNSSNDNDYFPQIFLEVIQRPKIIQNVWVGKDTEINDFFNHYSKTMINKKYYIKITRYEWRGVNTIKDLDPQMAADICHSVLVGKGTHNLEGGWFEEKWKLEQEQDYIDFMNKEPSKPQQYFFRLLRVFKKVKELDKQYMRDQIKK